MVSLEHGKQPAVLPDPNFLNRGFNETGISFFQKKVSMRPAYPSSKKVKDYDKLEAEVESIETVLSIDWKDVGAKKIESTLHDDLTLKTWKI
ncbi:hypothetical protein F2Q69_00041895 [Brassica cretica]|uniref:Uncharacterized protein n=1 Tax=Brassica cretica TaxID=69181 RepID=A0A8S9NT24_BRACR|nr:hypothetical protein F2Q69_00041895 [Brassica cretica]